MSETSNLNHDLDQEEVTMIIEDIQHLEVEDIKMLNPAVLLKALKDYDLRLRQTPLSSH